MDSDGDLPPRTPGDPHSALHPHTSSAPTSPPEKQARRPSKNAMKRRLKKLRQAAVALELEKEDPGTPQVRQISPPGAPEAPAGSHGRPETPAPPNTREKQERRAMKKAKLKKLREAAPALKLEQGPSELQKEDIGTPQVRQISPPTALATGSRETRGPDTEHIEEQAEKAKKKTRRNQRQRAPTLEYRPGYPLYSRGFIQAHYWNKEEMLPKERLRQARRLYSSSSGVTGSPEPAGARVRQSVLYSDRPSRSKRSTRIEDHVAEVSSREFEALTLDQSPPTPDSTHRPAGTVTRVQQSALYSGRPRQSRGRQEQKPSQNKLLVEENAGMASGSEGPRGDLPEVKALALNEAPPTGDLPELSDRSKECDIASSETESEAVVEEEPEDESDFDLEEELRKLKEYKEAMLDKDYTTQSDTLVSSCDEDSAVEHVTEYSAAAEWPAAAEWAKRAYITQDESLQALLDAQRTIRASSRNEPRCEVSDEEMFQNKISDEDTDDDDDIIENANKWMSEEVMVAFDEYIRRMVPMDELKELKYCFEQLCNQCFSVECYFKIFHHFNFTVKTKLASSDDWKLKTYFAEVKEIFGEKFYFCCPLEKKENGQCYACHKQGVNDLRHPATGGFERGLPDTVFPYM